MMLPFIAPYLLPIFPILYFYSENSDRMSASEMLLPGLASFVIVGILHALSSLVMKNSVKATLLTFTALCLLGSFAEVSKFISVWGLSRGLRDVLVLSAIAVSIGISAFVFKRLAINLIPFSKFIGIFTLAIVAIQGAIAANQAFQAESSVPVRIETVTDDSVLRSKPNIYYVILDAFGRSDIIEQIYKTDSSQFLSELNELGFFVGSQSHANYPSTVFSLSSALNSMYLDKVAKEVGSRSKDRAAIKNMIRESSVVQTLKDIGYSVLFLPSGYSGVDITQADERVTSVFLLNEFQNLLLSQSPIPAILRLLPWNEAKNWQYSAHRARVKFIFDKLPEIAARQTGPKFVFAHILTPHPPFVFAADGSSTNPTAGFSFDDGSHFTKGGKRRAEYLRGYAEQVKNVQRMLINTVRKVVAQDPDAIIIAQGDHGPGAHLNWKSAQRTDLSERFSIFNAYRVPPALKAKLYPRISPVNSFRLLMGRELLADRSFFFLWAKPYEFIEVTDKLH